MATTATTTTTTSSSSPTILPKTGFAKVQSVLSGDTVVLLGKATQPNQPAPQVLFTLSSVSAPVSLFLVSLFVCHACGCLLEAVWEEWLLLSCCCRVMLE